MKMREVTLADVDFTKSDKATLIVRTALATSDSQTTWNTAASTIIEISVGHQSVPMSLRMILRACSLGEARDFHALSMASDTSSVGAVSSPLANPTTVSMAIPSSAVGLDGILRLTVLRPMGLASNQAEAMGDDQSPVFLLQRVTVSAEMKDDEALQLMIPTPAHTVPAPAVLAGEAILTFDPCGSPGFLGRGGRHEKLSLYPTMEPLPQLPFRTLAAMPRLLVEEHFQYLPPPEVNIYAVHEGMIWANGVVTSGTSFVINTDIFPSYFRGQIREDGHSLPIEILKPELWSKSSYLRCDKPVACFLHPNVVYGHFLLEMLPKLYLLSELKSLGCDFVVAMSLHLPNWVKSFVEIYFKEEDLLYYNPEYHIIQAPSIIMPSMMQTSHNFHPCFNLLVADIHRRIGAQTTPCTSSPKRIFLSRSRIPYNRRLLNEAIVEKEAEALGLTIIHPQDLSICEQISLFGQAELIVGEYGSALHNTLFSPFGTKVVSIDMYSWYQSAIGRLRQQPLAFVAPSDGKFRHWRTPGGVNRVYEIDTSELRKIVEAANFS
jgi:hypothetical protein